MKHGRLAPAGVLCCWLAPVIALAGPVSLDRADLLPLDRVGQWAAPPVDLARLRAEDAAAELEPGRPYRIGFPMKADLAPSNSGTWEELGDGSRVWRLKVRSEGAAWIVLGFGVFRPDPGGELFVFDPSGQTVLGPFGAADIRPDGQLWFPPVGGDTVVVELRWPARLRGTEPLVRLGTVSHGYKAWGELGKSPVSVEPRPGGGDVEPEVSGACNIDINCPLGSSWQDQKRGVVMLLSGGSAVCTAFLVNNTANDCRPYVMTANHCSVNPSTITYRFNYERPGCSSGTAPTGNQVTGSVRRANFASSDFDLLELNAAPPQAYAPFFNGWSAVDSPAATSWVIHHPSGDVKKISFNDDPVFNGSNWGPNHWRVDNYEQGTTEPGSSGSPLFDPQHRVIGQLHGGPASCSVIDYDEYGKVAASWNGGGTSTSRLKDWLDPGSTGATVLDGIDYTFCLTPQPRLSYVSHALDDSQGNGNGIAEPGETLRLQVNVENEGTLAATGVGGTLGTSTPLVALTDAQATWPNIGIGQTEPTVAPNFSLVLDPAFPCGGNVALNLGLTASEAPGTWSGAFALPTGTASVNLAFQDDIEAGTNGWTAQLLVGANPWAQTTAQSNSPTHSWGIADPAAVTDSVLLMPILTVPPSALLSFRHLMNSEATFDGGVLEYSTNGTTWIDAGPLIRTGAYTGPISTQYQSPIGGRQAWSGNLGGWTNVEVDLASLSGQDLRLRWRFASDISVAASGWWIDDVKVQSTSYSCAPLQVAPGEAAPMGQLPFHVDKDPGGYLLTWSPPVAGGIPASYVLYGASLAALGSPPACEGGLGTGTSAVLATLNPNRGYVVVARNAAGEGSYGQTSAGAQRPRATGAGICP